MGVSVNVKKGNTVWELLCGCHCGRWCGCQCGCQWHVMCGCQCERHKEKCCVGTIVQVPL